MWAWLQRCGVRRSPERWIGGVAGGLASRWHVDPLVIRGAFVGACLLGGVGFLLYGLAWLLLPEPDGRIHAAELLAGRFDQAQLGGGLFVLVGMGPADWLGAPWGDGWVWGVMKAVGWLGVVGLVVWYLAARQHQRQQQSPWGNAPTSAGPDPAGSPAPSATFATTAFATTVQPTGAHPVPGVESARTHPWGTPGTGVEATTVLPPSWTSDTDAPTQDPATAAGTQARPSTPRPPAPPTPPAPPKAPAQSSGPGRPLVATVTAVGILAVAGLLLAERAGVITGGWTLTLGVLLAVVGLGIVAAGLAGRRGGWLTFLAIVGLVLSPGALGRDAGWDWEWDEGASVGSTVWTPTSREEAVAGVQLGAGQATIDLTSVPLSAEPLVIPIQVGAGEVVVTVPDDGTVRAEVSLLAGEVSWIVDGEDQRVSSPFGRDDLVFGADDGEARLVLQVQVGAGDVTIEGAGS